MSICFSKNSVSWTSSTAEKFELEFPNKAVDEESRIVHTAGGLGLGAICLIATANGLLVVCQKASVEGYEFSDQLVFPGGAVRRNETNLDQPLLECTTDSLSKRVRKEAGIHLNCEDLVLANEPVFTQYTVKKIMRYMVVVPLYVQIDDQVPETYQDHTVTNSLLVKPNSSLLERLAPANALAFANYMTVRRGKEYAPASTLKERSHKISLRFNPRVAPGDAEQDFD